MKNNTNSFLLQILFFLSISGLALMAGFIASKGNFLISGLLIAMTFAVFFLARPKELLLLLTVYTLLIAGTAKYFLPGFDRIWWGGYLIAVMLFIPAVLAQMNAVRPAYRKTSLGVPLLIVLLFLVFTSSIITAVPMSQVFVSIKSWVMYAGVWAFLAYGSMQLKDMKRWLNVLLGIAAFQIIPVLYQYIFVKSARRLQGGAVEASDSVVGTFGGSMTGGGLTAVLAFYMVISLLVSCAFYKEKILTKKQFLMLFVLFFSPLLLIEVKAIFVFLPISLIVLYHKEIYRDTLKFFTGAFVGALILILMLGAYQLFHWSAKENLSVEQSITGAFMYSFEAEAGKQAEEAGIMTRRQSIEFWFRTMSSRTLAETMLGHGIGSSKSTGVGLGSIAKKYTPLVIDRVGIAILLWETGILGTLVFILILILSMIKAGNIVANPLTERWQRALAMALQAIIPMFILSLFYRNDIPNAAPMMFLLMSVLGAITWLGKNNATE